MICRLAPVFALLIACSTDPSISPADEPQPTDAASDAIDLETDDGNQDLLSDVAMSDSDVDDGSEPPADSSEIDTDDSGPDVVADPSSDSDAGSDVAICPVETMDAIYPGFLPPNPYAPFPEASECVSQAHDVIIVLGCPNGDDGEPASCQTTRADMAVELAASGFGSRFITSGAAVSNSYVEAETLRDLLLARGVSNHQIWLEPQAEHTDENIYFSTKIMEDEGWNSALVVSDDPGHLLMTALCDSNCCVELGRLTLVEVAAGDSTLKVGHYVLYPWAATVSQVECDQIEFISKLMCLNADSRRACADDFQLDE